MSVLPTVFTNIDGSKTLFRADIDETYHSRHGAIAESLHVFIKEGLHYYLENNNNKNISIIEVGFGTGLNAMLSYLETINNNLNLSYQSIETIPLPYSLVQDLQYNNYWSEVDENRFALMHQGNWDEFIEISNGFKLKKINESLLDFKTSDLFDLVYFDAFGPDKQTELWQLEVFEKLFSMMNKGAIFVTYASKGDVRRALLAAGFKVEKIAGPPRKRHMLRAIKPS